MVLIIIKSSKSNRMKEHKTVTDTTETIDNSSILSTLKKKLLEIKEKTRQVGVKLGESNKTVKDCNR